MDVATTLANCLKNIISLAQDLKRTVDKIPQNRRNARKLSDELVQGLLDIENFYKARESMLEGTPELEDALANLLKQTQAVQERCVQLFTQHTKTGWRKIGAAMKAWRDCDQVEQEISELKDLVHECYRKFTMMAITRLEQPVNHINIVATTAEGTMLDESQTVMLGHMESFLTILQGSGSMGGPPPVFTQPSKDVINALYLHQQVENISNSLSDLSVSQTFAMEEPNDSYLRPFKPIVSRFTPGPTQKDRDDAHREVVAKTLDIISLLKGDSADLSIQDGAWEMVNLAIRLYGLEMYSDAEEMGRWNVTMFRALVATNPAVYEPYLSLSLRNLSRYKSQNKDHEGAAAVITESLEILRRHVQENPTLERRSQLSNTLNEYWSIMNNKGDVEKALEVAKEAVAITESIRAETTAWGSWLEGRPPSPPPPYLVPAYVEVEETKPKVEPETSIPSNLDEDDTLWLEYNTARSLNCLSFSLQDSDRIEEAYQTELRSLSIYQTLSQTHEGFLENLAGSCAHLSSSAMRTGRSTEESLVYAERAVEIYRTKLAAQPIRYSPWLLDSLWDYADLLHDAGRTDDVLRVTGEALELVRKSNQNQKLLADALHHSCGKLRQLKQSETAVVLRKEAVSIYRTLPVSKPSPSEPSAPADSVDHTVVPDALMDLANDLLVAEKLDDAVAPCKEAVDIYRAKLEQTGDSAVSLDLARSLSYLSYCMFRAKDYDAALKTGIESITIYRAQFRALGADFKEVLNYVSALRRTAVAVFYTADTRAVATNAVVLEDLSMLLVDHKEAVGKLQLNSLHDRDFLLGKHRRIREAIGVNHQMLKLFTPSTITDAAIAADYVSVNESYAGNLHDVGRPKDALLALEKAIELGSSFTGDAVTTELAGALSAARASYAACLHNFSRYAEAEAVMKVSVEASREHLTPAQDTLLACRYRTYGNILRNAGRLDEALKLGEESVTLCRASTTTGLFTEARLPYTLEAYATTVANSGDDQRALSLIQESIELYRKLRADEYNPLVPWAYAEPIYAQALVLLGSCLMATGDCEGAYEALMECDTIYRDLITAIPGQYTDYVLCLDVLAVNRRASGLEDEAKHIIQDLEDRQRAMEVFNPELAAIAHADLEQLRRSPFQLRLRQSLKAKLPSDQL
ncbi:hypothetical protein C0991_010891 [Blastosporella zonata]|nr:hypothetical protein C0991_010891 [Blastosporella zonata]